MYSVPLLTGNYKIIQGSDTTMIRYISLEKGNMSIAHPLKKSYRQLPKQGNLDSRDSSLHPHEL